MQANACAARRCRSLTLTTCFAAALELPKLFSKAKSNAKAAAKQVRAMRGQRRVAQALACICVICGFSSCVLWQSQKTEFTSKAYVLMFFSRASEARVERSAERWRMPRAYSLEYARARETERDSLRFALIRGLLLLSQFGCDTTLLSNY